MSRMSGALQGRLSLQVWRLKPDTTSSPYLPRPTPDAPDHVRDDESDLFRGGQEPYLGINGMEDTTHSRREFAVPPGSLASAKSMVALISTELGGFHSGGRGEKGVEVGSGGNDGLEGDDRLPPAAPGSLATWAASMLKLREVPPGAASGRSFSGLQKLGPPFRLPSAAIPAVTARSGISGGPSLNPWEGEGSNRDLTRDRSRRQSLALWVAEAMRGDEEERGQGEV